MSTRKGSIQCEYEKWYNPGEYSKKVESVRLSKNSPGEYQKRVDKCEHQKMKEFGRVLGKGRIRVSIEKLSGRVREKGRFSVSTKNGTIRASTRKR